MVADLHREACMPGSAVRHRPMNSKRAGAVPPPLYPRASRKRQELLDEQTFRGSQQRRMTQAPDTDNDEQLTTRNGHRRSTAPVLQQPHRGNRFHPRNWHPVVFILVGMVAMLALWFAVLRIGVWYINTFSDPGYYTQNAHLDTTTVTDAQGHQSQVHAFVDAQGRLDLFVLPDNDPGKGRVVIGSVLTAVDDPQHKALLIITATKGTVVTVTAQGPLQAVWFTASRQSAQWSVDVSQQQQGG